MFGPAGNAQLDAMNLASSYTVRVASLRDAFPVGRGSRNGMTQPFGVRDA
jgi:hypothetical protein